ncbi:MAG: PP0621 family protein [Methylotenera sp.]|nr:PP0621 family protein [Methylotenera sp.]
MWRLIFLGIIIYLLIVIFKRNAISAKNEGKNIKKEPAASKKEIETMVKCATCEVHLPRSEAYLVNGEFYCSKLHIPK